MDFKKLRNLEAGNKVKIDNKTYKIYKKSGETILLENEEYLGVTEYWMKREDDDKDFVLQIPEKDLAEHVRLLRAIKNNNSWTFNPSDQLKKVQIL